MSASKKKTRAVKPAYDNIPLLQWIMAIGVALFIFIFPYQQALFNGYNFNFESNIFTALIFVYILLTLSAFYLFRQGWKFGSHRGILSIAVMLFPVVYWASSFGGVAPFYAYFSTLMMFAQAALFVAALYGASNWRPRKLIEYAVMLTSYIIVIYGLFILFGQVYYRDGMWLSNTGYRLTSVFQYSNTYAGFLIAIFFAALYYTVHCKRWFMSLANALMLVPIWISFMLTYSRGAIVVIPVILLILIPFLRLAKQIAYIAYMVISVVLSMAVLAPITTNTEKISAIVQPTAEHGPNTISMFGSLPLQSWLMLLAAMAVSTAVIMHIQVRWSSKLETRTASLEARKGSFLYVPGIIIVLGLLAVVLLVTNNPIRSLLPDTLEARLETINFKQHSVLERWTFYEDGLKVAEDYPLLGAGGGAWRALFQQYQNNPYWSSQAHSYFIQTLVEVGWIGFAILMALLVYFYFLYIRFYMRYPERRGSHIVFFIISVSILLHSAIDFDMSYFYLSALVFVCLGAMLAPYGELPAFKKDEAERQPENRLGYAKYVYPAAVGVLSLVLLFFSIRETSANASYKKAAGMVSRQASITELLVPLNRAISLSPEHSAFTLTKMSWLEQVYTKSQKPEYLEEALKTAEVAKKHDPYNLSIVLANYRLLKLAGKEEEMLAELEDGLNKFRWDINFYEAAMVEYVAAGEKDGAKREQYWNRVRELDQEVQRRIGQLKNLPPEQLQGREFDYTDKMKEALAKIQ